MESKVLVIDAGLGNIGSVVSALNRLSNGVERLRNPPNKIETSLYTHVLLPGVGSFNKGMYLLRTTGWYGWILDHWQKLERPLLGICLGMQLLASYGSEGSKGEKIEGLNLIPGSVDPFNTSKNLTLPHVGWNSVTWKKKSDKLISGVPNGGDMYFVHSYTFNPYENKFILGTTEYGSSFVSAVCNSNNFGVQFHPEKSQRLGKKVLENFLLL